MTLLLERTLSSYYTSFKEMFTNLDAGLAEAQDITLHLKPLRKLIEKFEEFDYLELPKKFPGLIHVVGLVWANCSHYRQPVKLVVLLQEISNMIIEMVS